MKLKLYGLIAGHIEIKSPSASYILVLCGCIDYLALGNDAPRNFLTGFEFYEHFWLIDLANICIAIHLIGFYQVFCQPLFAFVDKWCQEHWPENKFITSEHGVTFHFSMLRLVLCQFLLVGAENSDVIVSALIFLFFNDFVGLIGTASFWPLTVYFPGRNVHGTVKDDKIFWHVGMVENINLGLLTLARSVQGLIQSLKTYNPFQA